MRLGDVPPPSWRTQIGNALYEGAKWPADQVNHFLDQMLNEHAHELAEKQRKFMKEALKMSPWATGKDGMPLRIEALIDLIDPEVTSDE